MNTYNFFNCINGQAPKFYELPKIHKPGSPLRPITAFYSNPIYNISKYISNVLQNSLNKQSTHYIKDSWTFKNKIDCFKFIPDNFTIFSLDVTSMYTNISWVSIISAVKNRWKKAHQFFEK